MSTCGKLAVSGSFAAMRIVETVVGYMTSRDACMRVRNERRRLGMREDGHGGHR